MEPIINPARIRRLQDLDIVLSQAIRGQSPALARVIAAVRRGELGLSKPGRPRGSYLLLGPTGVGKTETVVVATHHVFGPGHLFRLDMSEYQNQDSVGLLLGGNASESGHLGALRAQAAEGSLLWDEVEKAHPRVLDLLLQLLDAARIRVATGVELDFSGFHLWLTSNLGSSGLLSLEHSGDSTLERHVLAHAMAAFRPEIFARIAEKIVYRRLGYEAQLEIARMFLDRELDFLAGRGHLLQVAPGVMGYLVRRGFHPKLGARPMRDTIEKLVGDAVAERLLASGSVSGVLTVDESRECLVITGEVPDVTCTWESKADLPAVAS